MSTWRDPEKWHRGTECPICRSIADDPALAELNVSRLMMSDDGPVRGYAWPPFRREDPLTRKR